MNPRAIHLIGHSLGSHIAGFTGKTFTDLTGRRVGRISGIMMTAYEISSVILERNNSNYHILCRLDPAGPCFSNIDPELRLKATDADFVDVIHTDAGVYGLRDAVGHVDFFPNSGSQQPNCLLQTCSHSRAWLYYAESVVNKEAFLAVPCKDWDAFRKNQCGAEISIMGYGTRPSARGVYFLRTAEDSPYGLSRRGTVYENNEGVIRTIGSKILG
uniref:Putative lipase n=1 Tax=Bombyx mori TaxID=7091 RepID=D2KMR4_BOMMO|nr:putative lipase [Bombyx mori]